MGKPKGLIRHTYYGSKEGLDLYHGDKNFVRLGIVYWDEGTGSLYIIGGS